jgi:tetratricopeptide (TPR) repeat protein
MPDRHVTPRQRAQSELDSAYRSVGDGDLAHAAVHVAQAIATDPTFSDPYHELERIFATAQSPEELFPLTGDVIYIGNLAARAHIAARAGDVRSALDLLVRAAAHEPETPWLAGGAMSDAALRARVDPNTAADALARLARRLPAPPSVTLRSALEPFLQLAHDVADANPDHVEIAVRLSKFATAVGAHAAGVAWRTRAEAAIPGPLGAIMMGLALKDAGETDGMEAAWTRAVEADPDNLDVYVNLALAMLDRGRRKDANKWLALASARDPQHDQVAALGKALRYLDSDDATHLIDIVDAARAGNYTERIVEILVTVCNTQPWLNRVPMPTETTVNLANYIATMRTDGKPVEISETAITAIEPASATAAVSRIVGNLRVNVMNCPPPDLRDPLAPVTYQVWRYDRGRTPIAHLPHPSEQASDLLREVANLTWTDPVSALTQAARFADTPLDDLLGLLCHTPRSPRNDRWDHLNKTGPAYWYRLAQPWICLGILHHHADQPWPTSTRRKVLVDLVNGVEDWATDAALFALVVQAWHDEAARDDVLAIVRSRFERTQFTASRRVMTIAPSIAELVRITPGTSTGERAAAKRLIKYEGRPARNRYVHMWRQLRMKLGR